MESNANITRPTTMLTLRDSEYTVFSFPEGRHYQYTEFHSDGRHAVKVRVDRTPDKEESSVSAWYAYVADTRPEGPIFWDRVHGATPLADDWHVRSESHSHYAAPRAATVLAYHLVHKALFVLGLDDVVLADRVM